MTKSRAPDQEKSGTDHFEKSPILLPSPQSDSAIRREGNGGGRGGVNNRNCLEIVNYDLRFLTIVTINSLTVPIPIVPMSYL